MLKTAGEGLGGNEEYLIRNWRKEDSCYLVAERLAELCPLFTWKEEFGSDELRYLTEEIAKQSGEGATWLILFFFFLAIF